RQTHPSFSSGTRQRDVKNGAAQAARRRAALYSRADLSDDHLRRLASGVRVRSSLFPDSSACSPQIDKSSNAGLAGLKQNFSSVPLFAFSPFALFAPFLRSC